MYEGSESGFCVPAKDDLVSILPEVADGTDFEEICDFNFRVAGVYRLYGEEQLVCVGIVPVSKTQVEDEDSCTQNIIAVS